MSLEKRPPTFEKQKERPESCPHGESLGHVCQECIQASMSQPVWKTISKLTADSKYARSTTGPECTIERDVKKYEISLVQSMDEKTVQEIQELMEETFGKEEVDPIEVLRAGIDGKLLDGSKDVARYRIYSARDEAGKIQSMYAGGLVPMVDPAPAGEAMYLSAYSITRPDGRRQGLARELYASLMMQAAADATTEGKKLTMIVGESTGTSERPWNAIGRRRIYVETGTNEYSELRYVQPALDFDVKTGLPTEDAGEVSEHIMADFLEGAPDKNRISAAVESIHQWCNTWPRNAFENQTAYETHTRYVAGVRKTFIENMRSGGSLHLISADEREQLRASGTVINEYTEADHADDSPENA